MLLIREIEKLGDKRVQEIFETAMRVMSGKCAAEMIDLLLPTLTTQQKIVVATMMYRINIEAKVESTKTVADLRVILEEFKSFGGW